MAELHVITALVKTYQELSGKLQEVEKQRTEIKKQLDTINRAIRLYRTNFDVSGIKPRKTRQRNHYFPRGQFHRVVMDILREAQEPMTARELAIVALQRQGVDPDSDLADNFRRALNGALVRYAKEGKLIVNDRVFPKRWKIVS